MVVIPTQTAVFGLIKLFVVGLALTTTDAKAACPPGYPANLPCPSEPWETVTLEHNDRVARLQRLAVNYSGFDFEEDVIQPEVHGLTDYPTEIPILRVIADQSVFFDSGSDRMRPEASDLIDIIAESLGREPPDVALFVAGHTDAQGPDDYNIDLGMRRAREVSSQLIRRGVYQADIFQVSFGEHMPIADNNSWSGRARNRRVEFLFGARPRAIVPYLEKQEIEFCPTGGTDGRSGCDKILSFGVERVFIEPQVESQVVQIEAELKAIEIDEPTAQNTIQTQERIQQLEFQRNQIPVNFEKPLIFIEFSS